MVESPSSSTWSQVLVKLRFFTKIRRFVRKTSTSKGHDGERTAEVIVDHRKSVDANIENDDESSILQRSVKRLHFGTREEKAAAAREIKRLAGGEDLSRRKLMAELGVIPPLVAMVSSEYTISHRRVAVQALFELANGTCTNKALMVEAGILSKLSKNIGVDELAKHEFAQLIMSLSSLVNAQFPIDSSKILPLVLRMLESDSSVDTKMLCLGTLYNLSTVIDNVGSLAKDEVVHTLLKLSSMKVASEKALATLGNLVVTLMGKKALESSPMVPECLMEILTWDDKSRSQELSAYILMILAHQSSLQRTKMAEGGIVPILLKVALLGSPLAQKRALKLLQWFKDERQMKMGPHSGPQSRRLSFNSPAKHGEADEGKKLMKNMVRQSLYKNMETITRRANGDSTSSSKLKLLVISSSSKSLPY
ncbi:putative armadillo-like helical protein [Helianthus annuus]|nr:putative armadillo-like helical protein [Helianthus annuus]KAJ0645450.1 putative armadillo-like helical protein [Helianthus annuus]KAJ0821960.1 putative armadillo-like helical protein [Helianthus annuus]